MGQIDTFIHRVRHRLTVRRSLQALLWSMAIGGAALLAVALIYIFQGYAVPKFWYAVAGAGILAGWVVAALVRRATDEEASRFADEFFQLQDSVTSARRFAADHRQGGFYDLQGTSTAHLTEQLDPEKVPCRPHLKLAAGAAVLAVAALLTAFKSPSRAVLDRMALERQTEERTAETKEQLLKDIDELEKSLDEEEQKQLDPNELRKWVKELKATKDLKEAMRQLAELERKLNEASKNLENQRREEQLAKKAGEELQKEEDPQARELGRKLEGEKFKEAAQKLKDLKPQDQKNEPDKKKELDQKKKDLVKLKAAAKRMATAARQQKQQRNAKQNGRESENQAGQQQNDDDLEQMMEELDQDVQEMEEALQEENGEKCEMCEGKIGEKLDKLGKKLARMGAKKDAQNKLMALNKKLGQCQSYCQGRGQALAQGGLKPGVGTDASRRKEKDELKDNDQMTQLKGEKNKDGAMFSKVEAADDGTGISLRKAAQRERQFQKQFESFVQRQDVPEDVKEGVKNYFNAIHDAAAKVQPETPGEAPKN